MDSSAAKARSFECDHLKEAEDAGVIAKGQIESLINTIGIRRDMDADNRFIVNAFYQLFMRQAEMVVRLREVLHYQPVQQVTALVNAVIGCIPLGGSIAANVLSGGAFLVKEIDLDGFVESVLGIGKEACGCLVTDRLVDRFLQRTNVVLSVEEWEKKRKVVEDAECNLGLSVEELREKLVVVADMQSAGEDQTPSEHMLVEEVDEDVTIEYVSDGVASLSIKRGAGAGAEPAVPQEVATVTTIEGRESDLRRWEEKGVSSNVVGQLKRVEVAACFAALFLYYEPNGTLSFAHLKKMMVDVFEKKVISGEWFVEADEEEQPVMLDVMVKALREVTDEDLLMLTRKVKKFIELASQ